jgi:phospholipid transport system substrate-binding protein
MAMFRNKTGCSRRAFIAGAALALVWPPGPARAGDPVADFIERLAERAISGMAGDSVTGAQREARFRELLRENFDIQRIARFSLGRYARRVSRDQMREFTALFEDMTVLTYSELFASYAGQKLKVKKSIGAPGDKYVVVISEIRLPGGGQPIRLDWQVHVAGNNFAVVDIRVEGASMAVAQRAEFKSFLDRNKGDMAALIDALRNRVATQREKSASG